MQVYIVGVPEGRPTFNFQLSTFNFQLSLEGFGGAGDEEADGVVVVIVVAAEPD